MCRKPEMLGRSLALVLCTLIVTASPVALLAEDAKETAAPDTDALAIAVSDAQKANTAALTQYNWQTTTELTMEGESKATSIALMQFDDDGKLQSDSIGGESSMKQKRGLRGRAQKKKVGEFEEYLEGVLKQSFQYIFLSKGNLVDIFDKAEITEGEGGTVITSANLFVKGDALTMSVDPTTNLLNGLTFDTTYGEDAITGTVKFKTLKDGPNHPDTFELTIPSKEITITSNTHDWAKKQ